MNHFANSDRAQQLIGGYLHAEFLAQFADGGLQRALSRVDAAAGSDPPAGPGQTGVGVGQ
ncbi:hypothetical protein SDC9_203473 [bioreactor metagenome]|uniref:Uncharacterized protein n=1 Tax=bioreactor metagenome TaxID=1076179 RepID=A0A645IZA1_9ZZZZ